MDSAISILKRMQKYKTIGYHRSVDDWWNPTRFHPGMTSEQALHQTRQIFRFWTDIMDELPLIRNRLANIVLT